MRTAPTRPAIRLSMGRALLRINNASLIVSTVRYNAGRRDFACDRDPIVTHSGNKLSHESAKQAVVCARFNKALRRIAKSGRQDPGVRIHSHGPIRVLVPSISTSFVSACPVHYLPLSRD
jgi:hypothetical protein